MPISVDADLVIPTQDEFASLAFDVMDCFFQVHNEIGRFCDEKIYKREVAKRFGGIRLELPITLTHREYRKTYFADMLIRRCAIFEVKAVEALAPRHRAQALNYLLLTELPHGKLLNVRTQLVQHEFVNSTLRLQDRTQFRVEDELFVAVGSQDVAWKEWLTAAIQDWGTGLDMQLYNDGLTEFLGGEDLVLRDLAIIINGEYVGDQKGHHCGERVLFKITTLPDDLNAFELHARRFLAHTALDAVQWVNINRNLVSFQTLWRRDGLAEMNALRG